MIIKENVISRENCNEVIKNYLQHDEFQIINYEVKPFSDDVEGFMGVHYRLTIRYLINGNEFKKNFFIKTFPSEYKLQSQYAIATGAFGNELFAYGVLTKEFEIYNNHGLNCIPKFYYGFDNKTLIFEDLSEKGYVVPEIANVLDMEEIKLTLKALANFHAAGIAYQESKSRELGKKYSLNEEYSDYIREHFFHSEPTPLVRQWRSSRLNSLNAIIDILPPYSKISNEDLKLNIRMMDEKCCQLIKPKDMFYNVVLHGDIWGKNVMYRYVDKKPVDCILVDFQFIRYGPPAHDALQFIYLTTRRSDREKHLQSLLNYYYSCLKNDLSNLSVNIENVLSFEDFEKSVNYLLPQIKFQTLLFLMFHSANPEFYKKLILNFEDYKKFCFGDSSSFSLRLFKTDLNYKKYVSDALEDLKDHIIYPRITREDCYKILKNKLNKNKYKMVDYSYQPLNEIGGFMGDHYNLKINVLFGNKCETLNFFAKCTPDNQTRYDLAISSNLYMKEAFALRTLLPLYIENQINEIKDLIVPFHLIRLNEIVVFDDLKFLDFKAASPRIPFTREELMVVIDKIVIFHASSIILEEKLSTTEKPIRLGNKFKNEMVEAMFTREETAMTNTAAMGFQTLFTEIDLFTDIEKNICDETFKKKVCALREASFELAKPSTKYRNVICHGDLWASNIMMKYDKVKAVNCHIVDFQILRYCPPSFDLLSLLYLLTSRNVREKCLSELIDYYYKKFSSLLRTYKCDVENIYSYDKFIESCNYIKPLAAYQAAIYFPITVMDSDIVKEYVIDEETSHKFFLENRSISTIEVCKRDPIFREKLRESIQDIHDICVEYF